MTSAYVFNIQRFSINDGPGIRTTVFLKGCPLQCAWCHNPESINPYPELILKANRCINCGQCVPVCSNQMAGPLVSSETPYHGNVACTSTGRCCDACPTNAREMVGRKMSTTELLEVVLADAVYHKESGGGITFSGGEPVAANNAPFLLEILRLLRKRGIHTVVDTCGFAAAETMLDVANRCDLMLFDLKILDPARHRLATGLDNSLILSNLKELAHRHQNMWIRIPLIPGFTDDDNNLRAIGRYLSQLPKRYPVYLLPYNKIGCDKYTHLERDYKLTGVPVHTEAELEKKAKLLRFAGLEVHIGG